MELPMSDPFPGRPTVVVIGGGYGGVTTAKELDDVADVVLVEPKDAFVHNVAALRALVDPSWLPRIYLPYDGLLARGRVVRDRAAKVDAGRVTLASGEEIRPDYIVLATGSAYPFPAKSDVDSAAASRGKVRAAHAALSAAARVLLLGAGPVGIELSGEIKAVWPDKRVILLDVADDVLGARFRPDLKAELRRQLTAIGVELMLASPLREGPPTPPGELATFTVVAEPGREVTADLWFRCYGVTPVSDYLVGDLAAARRPDGFVEITPYLQVAGQDRVFAVGDVGAADHKMAGIAARQARVAAANIRALITGTGDLAPHEPSAPGIIVPIGPRGGSGQRPGSDELVAAESVAEVKGRDLMVARFADLLGVTRSGGRPLCGFRRFPARAGHGVDGPSTTIDWGRWPIDPNPSGDSARLGAALASHRAH
jgi:apoptosis-inducing factor 2